MSEVLGIDPGIKSGYALFVDGVLHFAGAGTDWPIDHASKRTIIAVIEKPEVYPSTPAAQANNLITLAIMVGDFKSRLERRNIPVTLVLPKIWKGGVPKKIHHARGKDKMTDAENQIVAEAVAFSKSCEEDIKDAVNIGLWKLGRLLKQGG